MIRVQTRPGPSPIHGMGVFAATDLLAGELISLGSGGRSSTFKSGCNSSPSPNVLVRCTAPACSLARVFRSRLAAWQAFVARPCQRTALAVRDAEFLRMRCRGRYDLFALRDIARDEELTVWDLEDRDFRAVLAAAYPLPRATTEEVAHGT